MWFTDPLANGREVGTEDRVLNWVTTQCLAHLPAENPVNILYKSKLHLYL